MSIEINTVIRNVRDGRTDDFGYIVDAYQKLIYHIVCRMIDHPQDREDVFQDIFFKAYKNLAKFRFESKFSTWIGRIAYNTCINYLRKHKVPLLADTTSAYEGEADDIFSETDTGSVVDQEFQSELLKKEIAKLPPQYKLLITLYHLHSMKYSEISKITNLPSGTVKNYLFRARQMLKAQITAQYRQEDLDVSHQ
ncbi:sigma-70 family RNA polymerase sigma factor [candidate division KSB1 bacterium]|nr:sigma-70 family RNA polymerase sigma factor [candidate division KSB1 bacterium]